jgi:phosphate transport system permease protein
MRYAVDRGVRYLLFVSALVSTFIVFLIFLFTLREGLPAFREIGVIDFLTGSVWRPGQEQYGILAMILGSVFVTIGAIVLGVPLDPFGGVWPVRYGGDGAANTAHPGPRQCRVRAAFCLHRSGSDGPAYDHQHR